MVFHTVLGKMKIRLLPNLGFTLIEILIVLSIVALLLTIALPRYFGSLDKSKDVALEENIKIIRISLDRFYADKGRYPSDLSDLVVFKYLRVVPIDPITESSSTWITISDQNPDVLGIVDVKSGAPGVSKDGRSYESF